MILNLPEVKMNTVKEIKYNPRCLASITVKAKGRNSIKLNKNIKIPLKQKPKQNSC
jgi:hypothetical protein